MTKEEKEELEKKITETQAELELWKKYRELKDEIDKLKVDPQRTIITYPIYIPTYPAYPDYPRYPWYAPYGGDRFYVKYNGNLTTTDGTFGTSG